MIKDAKPPRLEWTPANYRSSSCQDINIEDCDELKDIKYKYFEPLKPVEFNADFMKMGRRLSAHESITEIGRVTRTNDFNGQQSLYNSKYDSQAKMNMAKPLSKLIPIQQVPLANIPAPVSMAPAFVQKSRHSSQLVLLKNVESRTNHNRIVVPDASTPFPLQIEKLKPPPVQQYTRLDNKDILIELLD
jgi:hypothetical protein